MALLPLLLGTLSLVLPYPETHMTPFQTAVQDLVVAARGPDPDPVIEAAGKLLQECEQVTADDASWALAQLGPPLLRDEVAVYAPVVWVSEVLLGSGGDAWLILGPMIERLRDTLERAGRLVQGCRERASRERQRPGQPATSVAGSPDE